MKKTTLFYCVLAIAFGIFFFIYGGYDDSPGAQLIALVIVIIAIVGLVKGKKKKIGTGESL